MPAIQQGTVFVSGGSGYVGLHTVHKLLVAGFNVITSVRSHDKGNFIKKRLSELSLGREGKFDYVIVEDIEAESAFDEVIKNNQDIEAILHTASPFHFNVKNPEELVKPAVSGTVNILKAAHKYNKNIKRVVVTSSVASIVHPVEGVKEYTEKDWNDHSPKEIETKGADATPIHMYMGSKTLAERAAWKFVNDEKPTFDLVTVCPPLIVGPLLHEVKSPESLNTSVAKFYELYNGSLKDASAEKLIEPMSNIVDVRDVANTHVLGLTIPQAGGNRYISASDRGLVTMQDFADALHEHLPDDENVKKNIPVGNKGAGKDLKRNRYVNDKAKKELGQSFFQQHQSAVDTFLSIKEYAKNW